MDIILPGKKSRKRRYWAGGITVALALGAAAALPAMQSALRARPSAEVSKPPQDDEGRRLYAEIARIESDIDRYYDAMDFAEEVGDRQLYVELVRVSAEKNLEADTAWFRWQEHKRRRGSFAEGVKHAVLEAPPLPGFSNDEKFRMLSERHGLPVETLRALKAQMEVLFMDEMLEKFGPEPERTSPKTSPEEGSPDWK